MGIALCIFSGAANGFNNIYAKILNDRHFRPAQVLAVRFYLSLIASAVILLIEHTHFLPTARQWGPIFLIAFIATIIPIYFIQLGLRFCDAIVVSLITPFLPSLTFFLELLDPQIHFSFVLFVLTLLLSITVLSASIYKIKYHKVH